MTRHARAARAAAERALIRIVHRHYGARPEFVVLGGLVPELLCSKSPGDAMRSSAESTP